MIGDVGGRIKMYKYDVALSYESESQNYVREVSTFLTADGWNVYFALEKKAEMLSQSLKSKLYQIYQNESLLDVLFVTDKYLQSEYAMLEKRRALSCAYEDERRLIIVNFMGKRLPDELKRFVYLEGNDPSDDTAHWISERIKELKETVLLQSDMRKAEDEKKIASGEKHINVVTNTGGIIFGDSANLNGVSFNEKGK